MTSKKLIILPLIILCILLAQCKQDTPEPDNTAGGTEAITDQELYDRSIVTAGYNYYKDNDDIIESSPESAHRAFFRVRFNSTASAALTSNGMLPEGETFPEGSLIVKELHRMQDGSDMEGIAVMIKRPDDPNAAANGWVWAEYFSGASDGFLVSTKGASCTGCHSTDSRDMVRLFNLFP